MILSFEYLLLAFLIYETVVFVRALLTSQYKKPAAAGLVLSFTLPVLDYLFMKWFWGYVLEHYILNGV